MIIQTHELYITLPGSLTASQTIEPLDVHYLKNANCQSVQFVFEKTIDVDLLKQSFVYLLSEIPALAGAFDLKNARINDWAAGVPFKVDISYPARLRDLSDPEMGEPERDSFLDEPSNKKLQNGKAPITSIKLTNLLHGGCVLGVSISHGLMDTASFYHVIKRWSAIYRQLKSGERYQRPSEHLISDRKLFQFGSQQNSEEFLDKIETMGLPKPIDMSSVEGKLLKNARKLKYYQAMKAERVGIHFSPEELALMKDKILHQTRHENINTRAPLYAHLASLIGRHIYGNKKITEMQINNVFNINGIISGQGKQHKRYLGNALCAYTERLKADGDFLEASSEELTLCFENSFKSMSLQSLQKHYGLVADALRLGFDYPGIDNKMPALSFNNQSMIDVYDTDFGAGKLLRVIPPEVNQEILLYPAHDGGIDAYFRLLNKRKQEELASNKMHTRLHYYRPSSTKTVHMLFE